MDHSLEVELLSELLDLDHQNSAYLDQNTWLSPTHAYCDTAHFAQEQAKIFHRVPQLVAHVSELPEPGSFLRREVAGVPVLLTRDSEHALHCFINVCRHRGARLVSEEQGCKHRFSCPYHGWTWSNSGELRGIPHERQGFPGIDKSQLGLKRLECLEVAGWIWASPSSSDPVEIAAHTEPLTKDLEWLAGRELHCGPSDSLACNANWKLLIEGGIEAYHFRVAHRDTIGPYFPDNLSSYRMLGPHMRSILPRLTFGDLRNQARANWALREHANIVYTLFGTAQFLVQQDHVVWIRYEPLSADQTRLTLTTMTPDAPGGARDDHWRKNHQITMRTLREDFEIGESIQSGLASGANERFVFGRFEGALTRFAAEVEAALSS